MRKNEDRRKVAVCRMAIGRGNCPIIVAIVRTQRRLFKIPALDTPKHALRGRCLRVHGANISRRGNTCKKHRRQDDPGNESAKERSLVFHDSLRQFCFVQCMIVSVITRRIVSGDRMVRQYSFGIRFARQRSARRLRGRAGWLAIRMHSLHHQ